MGKKMEVVVFRDGKHAVRRKEKNGAYEYLDLDNGRWREKDTRYFYDCLGTKNACLREIEEYVKREWEENNPDFGTPISKSTGVEEY